MSGDDRLRTPPVAVPGIPVEWIKPGREALEELVGLLHVLSELANAALIELEHERRRGSR